MRVKTREREREREREKEREREREREREMPFKKISKNAFSDPLCENVKQKHF